MKKLFLILPCLAAFLLVGCSHHNKVPANVVRVGTIAGPETL
ncbi:MAG: hypothetical protein NTU49_08255 [Gammaproteobacteria bacterium]|nr:hypothetical protein [Gammaproteobacteria bacterium]